MLKDLSNRVLAERQDITNDLFGILDLKLVNGAYIITIASGNSDELTKKTLISK